MIIKLWILRVLRSKDSYNTNYGKLHTSPKINPEIVFSYGRDLPKLYFVLLPDYIAWLDYSANQTRVVVCFISYFIGHIKSNLTSLPVCSISREKEVVVSKQNRLYKNTSKYMYIGLLVISPRSKILYARASWVQNNILSYQFISYAKYKGSFKLEKKCFNICCAKCAFI